LTEKWENPLFGRKRELSQLQDSLSRRRLTIIYGPEGAGKKSLMRRFVTMEYFNEYLYLDGNDFSFIGSLSDVIDRELEETDGPFDIVHKINKYKNKYNKILLVIGDVDLMPRYKSLPPEAGLSLLIGDIKVLSNNLTRRLNYRAFRVVLTTSNGFLGGLYTRGILFYNSAKLMFIEGLDESSFKLFMSHVIKDRLDCSLPMDILERVSGRIPGIALELCDLTLDELNEWLLDRIKVIDYYLSSVIIDLSKSMNWNLDFNSIVSILKKIIGKELSPLRDPVGYFVAESLSAKKLLYLVPVRTGVKVVDPVGILESVVFTAANSNISTLADLDIDDVINYFIRK